MTTPTAPPQSRHADPLPSAATAPGPHTGANVREVSWPLLWRWASFIVGTIVLVVCAWALGDKVPQWTGDCGTTIVFLCFFLVMSIAGRWFWKGIDAALNRITGGQQ